MEAGTLLSRPPTHTRPGAEAGWVRLRRSPAPLCSALGLGLLFRPHGQGASPALGEPGPRMQA